MPALIIAILVVLALWWFLKGTSPAEQTTPSTSATSSTQTTASSTTTGTPLQNHVVQAPSISTEDTISSWDTKGFDNDNGPKEAAEREAISKLEAMLGKGDDIQIHISIAQKYDYIGEGELAYKHLSAAITGDVQETSGVAWHNLGVVMEKLGAYHTARTAYEQAIRIQPQLSAFHISRVELMIYHFPKDTVAVEKSFKDAEALFGAESPMLLDLRARWKTIAQ